MTYLPLVGPPYVFFGHCHYKKCSVLIDLSGNLWVRALKNVECQIYSIAMQGITLVWTDTIENRIMAMNFTCGGKCRTEYLVRTSPWNIVQVVIWTPNSVSPPHLCTCLFFFSIPFKHTIFFPWGLLASHMTSLGLLLPLPTLVVGGLQYWIEHWRHYDYAWYAMKWVKFL